MTIILPDDYHAREALVERRIDCISKERALRQDIRAMRIGILNIMPQAETYEYHLLFPLGRSVLQIKPVWIRLKNHNYSSTDKEHLNELYMPFEEAVKEKHLDGLLVTGAPVEEIPFKDVRYWDEICEIFDYARKNIISTLGICWGGLAIAGYMGIDKTKYPQKLFGVYNTRNLNRDHPVTGEFDDKFMLPHSRHSGIPDDILEEAETKGDINLLAYSSDTGYSIFESTDRRFLMHLGHPEYETDRLVMEYVRDMKNGRRDVPVPENIDLNKPVNTWRCHCLEFFSQWVKDVYNRTPY